MKYLLSATFLLFFAGLNAQVRVTTGNNSPEFKQSKQPRFSSFATDDADYFVIRKTVDFEKINTLVIADKTGNISTAKEIRIPRGTFNDNSDVNSLLVVGKTAVAFVENHSRDAGKNTLTARLVDANAEISNAVLPVGDISFAKMGNPGDWYTVLTPDKNHIAVIGKLPHEKDMPDQFKYYLLDKNLKEVGKGQFSFPGFTKRIEVYKFLASDKGDFYIVADEFDKSYKYPVVYKAQAGSATGSVIPVLLPDPGLRSLNYTESVNAAGDLLIAGYAQKKSSFSMGDIKAVGTWLFNSSKPQEVKTFMFEKPITNLTARNIVYNGDTFFVAGEQYKEEKEPSTATGLQRLHAEDNFTYDHGDILVTAYGTDGAKKFEIPVSRKWQARNFDQEFMVASGIINNKLALVFNDQYGKYIDDKYHKNYKLPVAVSITNDGLMEAPVHFAKELDVIVTSYTLYPFYFSAYKGRIVVLSANSESVKAITFQ